MCSEQAPERAALERDGDEHQALEAQQRLQTVARARRQQPCVLDRPPWQGIWRAQQVADPPHLNRGSRIGEVCLLDMVAMTTSSGEDGLQKSFLCRTGTCMAYCASIQADTASTAASVAASSSVRRPGSEAFGPPSSGDSTTSPAAPAVYSLQKQRCMIIADRV